MNDVERKFAIIEALNGYSGAAATLDTKKYLSFFMEDAEFYGVAEMLGQQSPLVGHDQIGGFFGTMFATVDWLMQQNTTTSITISDDGKAAQTSTGLVEYAKLTNGPLLKVLGRYDDELKLTHNGWKFSKRTLTQYRTLTLAEE